MKIIVWDARAKAGLRSLDKITAKSGVGDIKALTGSRVLRLRVGHDRPIRS